MHTRGDLIIKISYAKLNTRTNKINADFLNKLSTIHDLGTL